MHGTQYEKRLEALLFAQAQGPWIFALATPVTPATPNAPATRAHTSHTAHGRADSPAACATLARSLPSPIFGPRHPAKLRREISVRTSVWQQPAS